MRTFPRLPWNPKNVAEFRVPRYLAESPQLNILVGRQGWSADEALCSLSSCLAFRSHMTFCDAWRKCKLLSWTLRVPRISMLRWSPSSPQLWLILSVLRLKAVLSALLSPDKHCGTPREWPSFGSPWLAVTCSSCTTARCASRIWANGENLNNWTDIFGSFYSILLQKGPHGAGAQGEPLVRHQTGLQGLGATFSSGSTLLRAAGSLVHCEPQVHCTTGVTIIGVAQTRRCLYQAYFAKTYHVWFNVHVKFQEFLKLLEPQ